MMHSPLPIPSPPHSAFGANSADDHYGRKKVLLVTPFFLPVIGGAETGIHELALRLGHSVDVVVLTSRKPDIVIQQYGSNDPYYVPRYYQVETFDDHVTLERISARGRGLFSFIPPFSLSAISAVRKTVRQVRPDCILAFYAIPFGLATILAGHHPRLPFILSFMGRDVPGPETPLIWKYYARGVARFADRIIYISEYCRRALFDHQATRGKVVPLGVDTDRFSPVVSRKAIRDRLGIPSEAILLISVQRLVRIKRIDLQLRAFRKVLDEGINAFLLVIGKGPEEQGLRRLAETLRLGSRVQFSGYVPEAELPQFLSAADIFLFSSAYETFGVVLAQALASGLPIVAIANSAIPEVVDHKETGWICASPNEYALAEGVVALATDREQRLAYGAKGRTKALDRYNWDLVAAEYGKVIDEVTTRDKQA